MRSHDGLTTTALYARVAITGLRGVVARCQPRAGIRPR